MHDDSQARDLLDVLRFLRRHALLMVFCLALTAVAAYALSKHQRKQYTASASIMFRDPGLDQQAAGLPVVVQVNPQPQTDTNLKLLTLPQISTETAATLDHGLTAATVRSAITVTQQGDTQLATVAATAFSPKLAAAIANTYAQQAITDRQRANESYYANALRAVNLQYRALPPTRKEAAQGTDLKDRAASLQILKQLSSSDIKVTQPAAVPSSPSSPRVMRNALLGGLLGLLLGIGLALVLERLDRRLRDLSEVEAAYGLPILAAVPESPSLNAAHTTEPLPPSEGEAFGLLRARLRYFNLDRELRSLLITSATPGDGKTTIALHLAGAVAVSGGRVALIEADLRRPSLATRLGIDPEPGLADVISRSVALQRAVQRVSVPGATNGARPSPAFHILVAGTLPPNPPQVLESDEMRKVLSMLTERFDLVIIDSPPASIVPDAIPLTQQVSGVVVVTRVGASSRDAAKHLRGQLMKLEAPTLGVVANGLPPRSHEYYAYGYGYRSDYTPEVKSGQPEVGIES